jgi:hypothetical protein
MRVDLSRTPDRENDWAGGFRRPRNVSSLDNSAADRNRGVVDFDRGPLRARFDQNSFGGLGQNDLAFQLEVLDPFWWELDAVIRFKRDSQCER